MGCGVSFCFLKNSEQKIWLAADLTNKNRENGVDISINERAMIRMLTHKKNNIYKKKTQDTLLVVVGFWYIICLTLATPDAGK